MPGVDTSVGSGICKLLSVGGLFGHKYFSDMLAKDQQPVDFLKSKQLMKFNETLQLDMPTLKERLMAVVE